MKDESVDWQSIHIKLQDDRRSRLSDRPTLEDAMALARGELPEERRRHLVEWAAVDAEIAEMVQDVLRFGEGISERREDIPPETEEEAARRRRFYERLERQDARPRPTSAPTSFQPSSSRPSRGWWPMAASFLLGAVLTALGSWLLPTSAPPGWVNPTPVQLVPEGASGVRSGAVYVVSAESEVLTITLVVDPEGADIGDGAGPFRAVVSGPAGSTAVSDLALGPGGTVRFVLSREHLTDGLLDISLIDREGRTVATYRATLDLQ